MRTLLQQERARFNKLLLKEQAMYKVEYVIVTVILKQFISSVYDLEIYTFTQ